MFQKRTGPSDNIFGLPVMMGSVDGSIMFSNCPDDGHHDQSETEECFEKNRTDRMRFGKRHPNNLVVIGRHRASSFSASGW
jgi:hypothetical protein